MGEPRSRGTAEVLVGVQQDESREEPRGTGGEEARAAESVSVVLEDSPLAF